MQVLKSTAHRLVSGTTTLMAFRERPLTVPLITSVMAAVLGSLQIGYHTGNINGPERIFEEFFNQTWKYRYNESIPEHTLTFLWSLSVSIKDFGALLGSLGISILANTYGRKKSILIATGLSIMGVCLMLPSKLVGTFELFILGRFVFGIFCGLAMSLNPLYIHDVSPINFRGAFSTLNQVSYTSGIFLGMVVSLEKMLGTEKYWIFMLSLSLIPAIIQFIILPFCPESPHYLFINCKKEQEAEAALKKLRMNHDKLAEELNEMREKASHCVPNVTVREFFKNRDYRQQIILILIINLGSQLSGFNAIINYSTKIFAKAKFEDPSYWTLGVGLLNVAFALVTFFLVELAGRRILLLTGFLILTLCNLLMTITDSLQDTDFRGVQVVVVFCLVSAFELGPGPISWFLAAELFDQSSRPTAMAFTSFLNWGGKFLLALIFPPLLALLGAFVYLLFMSIASVAFAYTMYRLPETKGRTYDEIAAELRRVNSISLHNKMSFNTFK